MELYLQIITNRKGKYEKTIRFKSPYKVTKRTMLKTIKEEAPSLVALAIKENDMPFIADYSVHFVNPDGSEVYVDNEHTACITYRDVRSLQSPCMFKSWDFDKQKQLHPYWVMEYAMLSNPS
ncbi:MAG: hypothetical protein MJZ30_11525 [Paludibacteraceae bacterium]|nr:hypothetical protein [Paludibacteraceae bacterium]